MTFFTDEHQLKTQSFQFIEQRSRPFLPEIVLQGTYHLVVVVAYSLELFVEFCQPDVIVHRRLVYFHDLYLSREDGFLDEQREVAGF